MDDFPRSEEDKELSPCLSRDSTRPMMRGSRRRVALDVLMAGWGLGTWLGVNGLYMQLPLLVERLPEGWALPSSMALAVQLANSGILLYALLRRAWPAARDAPFVVGLLAVGTAALVLNAFLHPRTALVGGSERSVAFLALTYCAALVGCTSSVLFYPHLRHYRDLYLATYLVGEGLSGLLPALLALAQGVGGEPSCPPGPDGSPQPLYPPPRFGVGAFLLVLGALSAVSLLSFVLIDSLRAFASERVAPAAADKREEAAAPRAALLSPRWLPALALMALLNALMNGMLPAVQSYSCMPYGARAYHLAVTLSALANPAACLAGVWLAPLPARALGALLAAAVPALGYILTTALLSPEPPLARAAGGVALVVATWVGAAATLSYARMWLYGWARGGGARGMRAAGAATQLGSALGSALFYVLVNHTHLFTQPDACPAGADVAPPNATALLTH